MRSDTNAREARAAWRRSAPPPPGSAPWRERTGGGTSRGGSRARARGASSPRRGDARGAYQRWFARLARRERLRDSFYNSLEAENKKAALRERMDLAERRRTAAVEERRRAAESAEQAARAAEERRARRRNKRAKFERRFAAGEPRGEFAGARRVRRRSPSDARWRRRKRIRASRAGDARQGGDGRATRRVRRRLLAADARRQGVPGLVREQRGGVVRVVGGREPGRRRRVVHPHRFARAPLVAVARVTAPGRASAANQQPDSPSDPAPRRPVADRHRAMRKRAKKLRHRLHARQR